MSDSSMPFINSTGLVKKILDKIIEAQTPERYTQDFQSTVLGYGSGSAKPFIPLLKRIGFLNSDGTPTDLYKQFRNETLRGSAMAKAIKQGYPALYRGNEFAHKMPRDKLKSLVIQITGQSQDSSTVTAILGTFESLKTYADFENKAQAEDSIGNDEPTTDFREKLPSPQIPPPPPNNINAQGRGMNLSYTINLNLPSSKDPEVFNAIFKSLKENLLS